MRCSCLEWTEGATGYNAFFFKYCQDQPKPSAGLNRSNHNGSTIRGCVVNYLRVVLFTLIVISANGVHAQASWLLTEKSDPLTDERVTTAVLRSGDTAVVVRCDGSVFEVYVEVGEYLSNDMVSVRYRVDKGDLKEALWLPSAKGTAVFADEDAAIARAMASGSTFILEATDFRGQPHRVTFDLANSAEVLPVVLKNCGLAESGMEESVQGLREEIGLALERWGPKTISVNKNILIELGFYDGTLGDEMTAEFALAVQSAYDDYIQKCRDGEINGIICTTHRTSWEAGYTSTMPPATAVLYELAPKNLKKEAGSLRVGD